MAIISPYILLLVFCTFIVQFIPCFGFQMYLHTHPFFLTLFSYEICTSLLFLLNLYAVLVSFHVFTSFSSGTL